MVRQAAQFICGIPPVTQCFLSGVFTAYTLYIEYKDTQNQATVTPWEQAALLKMCLLLVTMTCIVLEEQMGWEEGENQVV